MSRPTSDPPPAPVLVDCLCGGGSDCECIPYDAPLPLDEAARIAGARDYADFANRLSARRAAAARTAREPEPRPDDRSPATRGELRLAVAELKAEVRDLIHQLAAGRGSA